LLNLPYTNEKRLCSNKTLEAEFSKSVTVGKTYTFSFATNLGGLDGSRLTYCLSYGENYDEINRIFVGIGKHGKEREVITFTATSDKIYFIGGVTNVCEYWDFQLEENTVPANYIPYKSNKIQFSSIEPLRGVGDVKDRFVFKDGKLMIERNCGEVVLDGSESWRIYVSNSNSQTDPNLLVYRVDLVLKDKGWGYTQSLSDTLNTYTEMENAYWKIKKCLSLGGESILICCEYQSLDKFKQWLSENPTTVIYQLAEAIYEEVPYETQKLILEGYENGTLFLDTNIPPTVTASYTANIPLVSKVNKVNETTEINTEDIAITQMAVDFLLMSTLGEEMLNFKVRSGYNMASYFASRIIKGALKYEDVIKKYPQYKEDINSILVSEGYSDLIVEL
jgi:hypothetical protein